MYIEKIQIYFVVLMSKNEYNYHVLLLLLIDL